MSRRQRKKEIAKQAAASRVAKPEALLPSRPKEEIVLGPDGFVDRLVRMA